MISIIKQKYLPSWVRVETMEIADMKQKLESKALGEFRETFWKFQSLVTLPAAAT